VTIIAEQILPADGPSVFISLILGLIQGLTEFLPISSSGHLVLAQALFKVPAQGIVMEVVLHGGTLLAVLATYRADLIGICTDLFSRLRGKSTFPGPLGGTRLLWLMILATLPVLVVGLLWKDAIEGAFENSQLAAGCLLFTGALLIATRFARNSGRPMGVFTALIMGTMQVISLLPGVSRSGSTISGGLFAGSKPAEIVRFSFLMSIPAILGSIVLELPALRDLLQGGNLLPYGVGFLASFLSGLAAIQILLRVVASGRFFLFGLYCLIVGIIALLVI
jgi:undecaprenyl-diphosphatase